MKAKNLIYYNIEKLTNLEGSENGKQLFAIKIEFLQPFTIVNLPHFDKLKPYSKTFGNTHRIILDFKNVQTFDSSLVLFLNEIKHWAKTNGVDIEVEGLSNSMLNFWSKFSDFPVILPKEHTLVNPFLQYFSSIGEKATFILYDYLHFFEFFGELIRKIFGSFLKPKKIRWEDFPMLFLKNGVNALPIVSLILLLIGIISGYQGAIQLKQFGADIYIADLIGISITRELGPLMTAILIAGRSGSAFAAELGTMKVSEEIDALKSMGFDPFKFLVIPRILSVTFSIPLLTMFGNLAGVIGGLISGLSILDITSVGYFTELQLAVGLDDIFSGLIKSVIFGFLVAAIGCFRGLQVKGGAEGVGAATTISVVSGIFAIIIADTLFTFIFDTIGL